VPISYHLIRKTRWRKSMTLEKVRKFDFDDDEESYDNNDDYDDDY